MLSKKIEDITTDEDLLRLGIIAEFDAISLYLQSAKKSSNKNLKKVFLDIAKEEKTHVGEFLALLNKLDTEQLDELKAGNKEVKDLTKSISTFIKKESKRWI